MTIKTLTAEIAAIYAWADALADMGQIELGLAYLDRKADRLWELGRTIGDLQYENRPIGGGDSRRRSYGYTDYPRG